MAQIR